MPMPGPTKGETRDKFISRCMGNETMKKEFPDNKQRVAVCFSKWKDHNKMMKSNAYVEDLIEAFIRLHPELVKETKNDGQE